MRCDDIAFSSEETRERQISKWPRFRAVKVSPLWLGYGNVCREGPSWQCRPIFLDASRDAGSRSLELYSFPPPAVPWYYPPLLSSLQGEPALLSWTGGLKGSLQCQVSHDDESWLQAMAGRRGAGAGAGAGAGGAFPQDEDLLNQLPPEVEQELRDLAGDLNLHQLG